jgi:hypothetical protein
VTYLRLRETEVRPDYAEQVKTSPKECSLATPVPCSWVHESRLKCADDNTKDIIHVSGEHHRLDSQPCRWKLCDQRVTDRSDSEIIDEGENKDQGACRPANVGAETWNTQPTNDHQNDEHDELTPKVLMNR